MASVGRDKRLHNFFLIFAAFLFAFLLSGDAASAATYYVSASGNPATGAGTFSNPWSTIQKAAETMNAGDTVYVRGGTYNEQVRPRNSGTAGNPITYSSYPGETAIIDGTGISMGIYDGLFDVYLKNYITVSGFNFRNSPGRGVKIQGNDLTVSNNSFTGSLGASAISTGWYETRGNQYRNLLIENNEINTAETGVCSEMISTRGADNLIIRGNHIYRSKSGCGGGGEGIVIGLNSTNGQIYNNTVENTKVGLHISAYNSIKNLKVYNNVVKNSYNGGVFIVIENNDPDYVYSPALIDEVGIFNNLIYDNNYGMRIAPFYLNAQSVGTIKNVNIVANTFYSNNANVDLGNAGEYTYVQNVLFRNNIFSDGAVTIYSSKSRVSNINFDHNLFYNSGTCQGTNCLTSNPQFVNPSAGDFHLQSTSPAIDVGSSSGAPSFDFDNKARSVGSGYDIGAFEYGTAADLPPTVSSSDPTNGATNIAPSKTITVTFSENIQAGANYNSITLKDSSSNLVSTTNSISASTLTIDPIPTLSYTTAYTVTIPASAVKDMSNNGLANQYTFSFTTSAQPVLTSIDVSPSVAAVLKDNVQQFTAQPKDQFGNAYATTVSWSSSNTTVGTINAAGLFTALNYGTTTIAASSGGISGAATANVVDQTPGLIAHWKFDENAGTTASDSSGNANAGTVSGASWTAGKVGQALQFDGVNDYVTVPDSTTLDTTTMTFMAWIKNSKADSAIANSRIASKKTAWNDANGWSIEINSGGGATVLGSGRTFTTVNVLPGGWNTEWHHLAVVMSGTQAKVYLDGSLKGTSAIDSVVANNVALAIGRLGAGTNYFSGAVDEAKVFSRALSDSDVETEYRNYLGPDTTPPAISSTDPASGATSVAPSKIITATFSESVQASTSYDSITLKDSNNNFVSFTKTISGSVLTIDPTPTLANTTTYTVTIPASAVKDLSGNNIENQHQFSFTVLTESMTERVITIATNGISEPFNFINRPAAAYYNGRTYVAWQGTNIDPYITYYDHNTKTWGTSTRVGDNPFGADSHGAPSIVIDNSGYIYVFYGSHGTNQKWAKSNYPEDISRGFTVQPDIAGSYTYPNPIKVGNSTYLFLRNPSGWSYQVYDGRSWGPETTMITMGLYLGFLELRDNKIHMAWTYHKPDNTRRNVYYAYLDLSDSYSPRHMYSITGRDLGPSVDLSEANAYALVRNTNTKESNAPSIHLDSNGYPWIIYTEGNGAAYQFYQTRWTGSAWSTPKPLARTDNQWNYVDFIINSETDATAYLTSTGTQDQEGGDIEQWHWNGMNWSKVKTILSQSSSGRSLNSPLVPFNFSPELKLFFTQYQDEKWAITDLKVYAFMGSTNTTPGDNPPSVSVNSPSNGATVSGTTTVSASAADDKGVSKVEFYIDNSLKSTDAASPYSYSWNTSQHSDGQHTIKATAYDTAGQTASSQATVTVSNILPPSGGIAAYWKFDGDASDSSGNTNAGTITGASWIAGKVGQALQFDGVNDYVTVPDSTTLDTTTMTFMAWIKNSKADSAIANSRIASKKTAWNDANGWSIEINSGGGATVLGSGRTFTTVNVLPGGWNTEWHHLAVVMSGTQAKVYLDGSLKGTNAIDSVVANNVALVIGRLGAGTNYFSGAVDETKVFSRALSASEIYDEYIGNKEPDTTPPSSVLVSPRDFAAINSNTAVFSCSASDNAELSNITLYGTWNNWQPVETKAVAGTSATATFAKHLIEGSYEWSCLASDSSSNSVFASANRTITIDTTPPSIELTDSFNKYTTKPYASIEITSDELLSDAFLEWEGINKTMSGAGKSRSKDTGILPNGNYTFRVYASDLAGNWNMTETKWVYVNHTRTKYRLNITVRDEDNNIIPNAKVRIYNSTHTIIPDYTFDSNNKGADIDIDSLSEYSMKYSVPFEQALILMRLGLKNNFTISPQFTASYSGALPAHTETRSGTIALDASGILFDEANLTLPITGEVNRILHCTSWDFASASCGNWESNELSSYRYEMNSTHLVFTVSEFDAYAAGYYNLPESCSDGMQNQGETGIDCGGPCASCSSGGGGNGGGEYIYTITTPGTAKSITLTPQEPLTRIYVSLKAAVESPSITVAKLASAPVSLPSGHVYQYLDIMKAGFENSNIESAEIEFKVGNGWISSNNITDVYLARYENGWEKLGTELVESGSEYSVYSARTSGFSYFAIVGESPMQAQAPAPSEGGTGNNTTVQTPENQAYMNYLGIAAAIIAGLLVLALLYGAKRELLKRMPANAGLLNSQRKRFARLKGGMNEAEIKQTENYLDTGCAYLAKSEMDEAEKRRK